MVELKNIGEVIAKERRARKITQKELAKELCVAISTLSLYEIGRRIVPVDVFIRFCVLMGLNAEDFIEKGEQ